MDIRHATLLVTGANRGLGLAFARAALAAGARKVYAAARDSASVTLAGVEPLQLDVTNPQHAEEAARRCGDVTLLINNAGIARGSSLLAAGGPEALREELETNCFGPLSLSRAFAPVLAAHGGGAIVNMLSVLSWVNLPGGSTYCTSKSAAWGLTNGLRNELRAQGTLVVGVHVGFMDTDLVRHVEAPKASPDDVAAQVFAAVEAGREEVLADALSRQVKHGLAAEPGVYLRPAG
ncbi:SDR family oxidoreductase [Aquincola sp. MAHUQ-54]|uniref:SDR family oxidoreductase n=1 Tax=Aquincola agrisoli TaxID=3119538 RepID=A0AAW9QCM0_9BURK